MDDLTNPNLSPEELEKLLEERKKSALYLKEAEERAKQADIENRLKVSESEWEANRPAREAKQAKEAARKAELLSPEEWKKQYPQYLEDTAENMVEKTISREEAINLGKRAAKIDRLKSLAKGLGKSLAEGMALGIALDPSEIAPSELPYNQEDMDSLESEMKMKNAPYNYPTRFESLRKRLGR